MNTRVGVTPGACPLRASLWPYSYYNSGRAGGEIGPNFGFITKGDDNDGELQFSCAWSPRWMGQRDAMGRRECDMYMLRRARRLCDVTCVLCGWVLRGCFITGAPGSSLGCDA